MSTSSDICIVSGSTHPRLPSPVNHRIYANTHGLDYRFECGSAGLLKDPFYYKLDVITRVLPRYGWVFWVDDDAFFTDFTPDVRGLARNQPSNALVTLADGRVQSQGQWSRINSGVLLVRNHPDTLTLLKSCLDTAIATVEAWWRPEEHGMFTHSDQDVIVHHMHARSWADRIEIRSHLEMNARGFHYRDRLDEHFICHFPGLPRRRAAIRRFGARFGVGPTLVPRDLLIQHGFDERIGETFIPPERRKIITGLRRRLKRLFR